MSRKAPDNGKIGAEDRPYNRGVEFHVLGPLRVTHEGAAVGLGGPQQQTILGVLLVHAGSVVSAERLIDEVWGENTPESARRTLQSSVARLRGALNVDTELLRSRAPGYVLDVDPKTVDSLSFAATVEGAAATRSKDPARAAERLRQALATWQGRPFDGLADTAPSLYAEVVRLEELRLTAIELRVECDLEVGRHRELVAELEYLTSEFPLRERFWQELMAALYRCGRQADALRAYQRARHILAAELGIDPGRELQELEEAILRQDPLLAGADAVPATTLSDPPRPGRTLRGYELRELVGTRCGESVYRAYQPTIGREVAVTAIDAAVASEREFIRRFDDEVRRIARLEHPHIVPVYDFWRDPTGAFIVSRWVGGVSLRSAVGHGPWRWEAALRTVAQVAGALRSAHRRGVAHGHLTSLDVVVDQEGNAYVTGFQHSLLAAGAARSAGELAQPDPQQIRNDTKALGMLLVETMSGTPCPDDEHDRSGWATDRLSDLPGDVPGPVVDLIRRAAVDTDGPLDTPGDLIAAIEAVPHERTGTPRLRDEPVENPYKGLRPFREADAQDFFGRDALVAELVTALAEGRGGGRFVAVVGPSGCGKSSAVRAGLVPAIRHAPVPGSDGWFVVTMVPGRYPFEELAAALLRIAASPDPTLLDLLTSDETGVRRAVDRVLPVDGGDMLMVLDQMEELFTLTDVSTRRCFIEGLVHAVVAPQSRVRVVATLRADFYDRPLHHRELSRLVTDGLVTVVPLTAHELQRAITGPANRVGVAVAPDLVARLIGDVADRPGALPLLQYVLTELFDARDGGPLTVDGYEAIGGIDAAVGHRAEEVFASLADPARRATRRLFLRLVTIGETEQETRSRVGRRSLSMMPGGAAIEKAIEAFSAARLLELDADPVSGLPTVQVAHEAIFRAWPRLDSWIDTTRGALHARRRLDAAAADWAEHDRDDDYLATGSRLDEFEALEAQTDLGLLPLEEAYVAASRSHRDAARRRIARRRRGVMAVLLAAFIIAASLASIAVGQRRTAESEARVALARELAAESVAALDVDPELSILLALEAVDATAETDEIVLAEAEEALHLAVQADRLERTIPDAIVGAFGPDGTTYAAGDALGSVRVWNLATGVSLELPEPHDGPVTALTFDPSGDRVISGSRDGEAKDWNTRTGTVLTLSGHLDAVLDVAVSPDERLLATTSVDGTARVWDVAIEVGEEVLTELDATAAVAFDPADGRLAVADPSRPEVRVIDPLTGETITVLSHDSLVTDLAFVGDGSRIAGASREGTVVVWDVDTGMNSQTFNVSGVAIAFSSRGDAMATGGDDGVVRVWDTTSGLEVLRLAGHRGQVTSVSFHPNGTSLASTGADGRARVWDISPEGGREVATLVGSTNPTRLVFSADSRSMGAAGAGESRTVVWDTTTWTVEREIGGASDVAIAPDGSIFATIAEDRVATVWDMDGGVPLFDLDGDVGADAVSIMTAITFTPDGRLLITGDVIGTLRVWAADSGRLVRTMAGSHLGTVEALTIDAAGRYVLSIGSDANDPARLWDIGSGRPVSALAPVDTATAAALSPDGTVVLTGGADGVTRAWSADTGGALEAPIMVGSGTVRSVAYSADGARVATAGDDGSVRLWDGATGELLMRWPAHEGGATDVAFSPDGRLLATAGRDGTVRVYVAQVEDLVGLARSRVARVLSDDECRRYLHLAACPEGE